MADAISDRGGSWFRNDDDLLGGGESERFWQNGGRHGGEEYTLTNSNGAIVKLISRGATLTEWHVPDKNGKMADVVFGFDDVAGYESKANGYFGCTAGRVANRIAGGKFTIDGKEYTLATNDGPNTLHGGVKRSLDKVVWNGEPFETDAGEGVVVHVHQPRRRRGLSRQARDAR